MTGTTISQGRLSDAQRHLYGKIGSDWAAMPAGIGCTNSTLNNLEKRGLIELRVEPGTSLASFFVKWQVRRVPDTAPID